MEVSWSSDHGLPHSTVLEWDPEDRAKLHAHLLEEATRCQLCGTQPREWDENKRAYVAVDVFCNGCYNKQAASEGNDAPKGTTIQLVPYTPELIEKQRQEYERNRARKQRDQVKG